MITTEKPVVGCMWQDLPGDWIVQDHQGRFWMVPSGKTPGRDVSRFSQPKRPTSSRFPAITSTCSVCPSEGYNGMSRRWVNSGDCRVGRGWITHSTFLAAHVSLLAVDRGARS